MEFILRILRTIFGPGLVSVDADAVLTARARAHREPLDWRNSIVDLLKVLDLDSSFAARVELAEELGNDDYTGTPGQNMWLHDEVMKRVRNGKYR